VADGVEFVWGTILASPVGSIIVEWDEAAREELVADILKGYGECFAATDDYQLGFQRAVRAVLRETGLSGVEARSLVMRLREDGP